MSIVPGQPQTHRLTARAEVIGSETLCREDSGLVAALKEALTSLGLEVKIEGVRTMYAAGN